MNNIRGLLDMAPMPNYQNMMMQDDTPAQPLVDDSMPYERIIELLLAQSTNMDLKKQIQEMLKRKTQGTIPVVNPGRPTPMGGTRG